MERPFIGKDSGHKGGNVGFLPDDSRPITAGVAIFGWCDYTIGWSRINIKSKSKSFTVNLPRRSLALTN